MKFFDTGSHTGERLSSVAMKPKTVPDNITALRALPDRNGLIGEIARSLD
jgi:hypothetical protein